MSADTRSDLQKLSQSGKIPISSKSISESSDLQVSNALMLFQNRNDLKEWRDEIRGVLHRQDEVLEEHSKALAQIGITTTQTNGKVKVLRSETDTLNAQVKAILDKDGERTNEALTQTLIENAQHAVTKDMVMFKRPSLSQVASLGGIFTAIATGVVWTMTHIALSFH